MDNKINLHNNQPVILLPSSIQKITDLELKQVDDHITSNFVNTGINKDLNVPFDDHKSFLTRSTAIQISNQVYDDVHNQIYDVNNIGNKDNKILTNRSRKQPP